MTAFSSAIDIRPLTGLLQTEDPYKFFYRPEILKRSSAGRITSVALPQTIQIFQKFSLDKRQIPSKSLQWTDNLARRICRGLLQTEDLQDVFCKQKYFKNPLYENLQNGFCRQNNFKTSSIKKAYNRSSIDRRPPKVFYTQKSFKGSFIFKGFSTESLQEVFFRNYSTERPSIEKRT